MKKILTGLLSLSLLLTLFTMGAWADKPETVDPSAPGAKVSDKLNTSEHFAYIMGYPDGTVKPEKNLTRGEAASIFYRLLTDSYRKEIQKTTNDFSDVSGTWYNTAVSTLENGGIIKSNGGGKFRGEEPITRAEYAGLAARFTNEYFVGTDVFNDIANHWARQDINLAASYGWVTGYPNHSFKPDGLITRAEVMTLTNNILGRNRINNGSFLTGMLLWPDNNINQWHYNAVQEATNSHNFSRDLDGTEHWTALYTAS
ncbi:MAG: S-layer homology domain-containing protein [Oscillospiraceae bacterium]